ncbi:MAG: ABC transporter permease [Acidimicrobiales bacterium]|nr:ABC transporter permease [Acidimicrobiales bacterium]
MAVRFDYIAKETAYNIVRNPSLSIATVLTVAVSLSLLGAAMVIREGVSGLQTRFKDDVEFIIWINNDASDEQVASVQRALDDSPVVKSSTFVNRAQTFAEFEEYFAESPEVLAAVTPEDLPTSFRVVPVNPELSVVEQLGRQFAPLPGVRQVDFAGDYIRRLNQFSSAASITMTVAALASGLASSLLMYNTIRTALFARRREVEVMRLVGATNWFIRIPFMLEGLLQGLVGAAFSAGAVLALNGVVGDAVRNADFRLFDSFALTDNQLWGITLILLAAGALIGAVGSGVAVSRYLDA